MSRLPATWLPFADATAAPLTYLSGRFLRLVRNRGIQNMPKSRSALMRAGVYPVLDQYYEPMFDSRHLTHPLSDPRALPGIDWNIAGQLALLDEFDYNHEFADIPNDKPRELTFYLENGAFEGGDAELWYNLIRLKKPRRIMEIGSGNSTLMALKAVHQNTQDDPQYSCQITCVEPYEQSWLERTGVSVVRRRVEELGVDFFAALQSNDILFIDSSHVIRPQGDVLFEYLQLLPTLNPGVIVHIHDIFSPRDYPTDWVVDQVRMWNEQYLLEAFLTHNSEWKVLAAVNHLSQDHRDALAAKSPLLSDTASPGSFYIQRNSP